MNKAFNPSVNHYLNQQSQMLPPKDDFDVIMDQVHQQKRQRSFRMPAIAAAVLAAIMLWQLPQINNSTNNSDNNDQAAQLALLTDKIAMIEYVVRNEVIRHSEPGSPILEKMISMENWLDQLDLNIAQTNETSQKIELLHAKLEILDDLVALHKKYKPPGQSQVI
jgi:uncharacterized membrane protein YhiD involved in acid resistance